MQPDFFLSALLGILRERDNVFFKLPWPSDVRHLTDSKADHVDPR